jgi:hypothetical protein
MIPLLQDISLQDLMNEMFSGRSTANRGTLFHMKTTFGHKSVKKSVTNCFNHATDFIRMTAEGLLCLLVMDMKGETLFQQDIVYDTNTLDSIFCAIGI